MRWTGPLPIPVAAFLAACGGTTTDPPPPEPDIIAFETFAQGQEIARDLARQNADLGPMDPLDIPFAGSAAYQGTAEISSTAGLNAIGVLEMEIVFDSGLETVTGFADDFVDVNNSEVDGTLTIGDGGFDRSGSPGGDLTATVSGTFEGGIFVIANSDIAGDLHGEAEGVTLDGLVSGFVSNQATTFNVTLNAEVTE